MLGPGSSCPAQAETEGRAQTWVFLPRNDISQLKFPAHWHPGGLWGRVGLMLLPTPTDTPAGNALSSSTSLQPWAQCSCCP